MNNSKITVVVVTYNRKAMLQDCISGILSQTRAVDKIIIVDNASSDGTSEVIQEKYESNTIIDYIRLDNNEGSSGGFHEGVKKAYEEGADWIWFLDDDVSPSVDCLEKLLQYEAISHCIHPSKKDSNGKEFMWEPIFNPATGTATFLNNISFRNGKEFAFVNIGCFEGMLAHRDVVAKVGYPDKRFFIVSDDTTYGFVCSLFTNVVFVRDAMLNKLVPFNEKLSHTFMYYVVRNQFIIKEYLKKYGLYNPKIFNAQLAFFVVYSGIKQTVRNGNFKIPWYIIKGLAHGTRERFYKL